MSLADLPSELLTPIFRYAADLPRGIIAVTSVTTTSCFASPESLHDEDSGSVSIATSASGTSRLWSRTTPISFSQTSSPGPSKLKSQQHHKQQKQSTQSVVPLLPSISSGSVPCAVERSVFSNPICNLSLACRTFYHLNRRILFDRLHLDGAEDVMEFQQYLARFPHLVRYVKRLSIGSRYSGVGQRENHSRILAMIHALDSLFQTIDAAKVENNLADKDSYSSIANNVEIDDKDGDEILELELCISGGKEATRGRWMAPCSSEHCHRRRQRVKNGKRALRPAFDSQDHCCNPWRTLLDVVASGTPFIRRFNVQMESNVDARFPEELTLLLASGRFSELSSISIDGPTDLLVLPVDEDILVPLSSKCRWTAAMPSATDEEGEKSKAKASCWQDQHAGTNYAYQLESGNGDDCGEDRGVGTGWTPLHTLLLTDCRDKPSSSSPTHQGRSSRPNSAASVTPLVGSDHLRTHLVSLPIARDLGCFAWNRDNPLQTSAALMAASNGAIPASALESLLQSSTFPSGTSRSATLCIPSFGPRLTSLSIAIPQEANARDWAAVLPQCTELRTLEIKWRRIDMGILLALPQSIEELRMEFGWFGERSMKGLTAFLKGGFGELMSLGLLPEHSGECESTSFETCAPTSPPSSQALSTASTIKSCHTPPGLPNLSKLELYAQLQPYFQLDSEMAKDLVKDNLAEQLGLVCNSKIDRVCHSRNIVLRRFGGFKRY